MNRITITLKEYLDGGYGLPSNIEKFYELSIDNNIYNVREMFIKRNLYKEIGSETQELFMHNLSVLIDEALTEFNPRLKILNENFNDLMKRTIEETTHSEASGNTNDKNYLNPANATAAKLTDKNERETSSEFDETRQKSFGFVWSNGKLMAEALKIQNVFLQILSYLDKAFIGEY